MPVVFISVQTQQIRCAVHKITVNKIVDRVLNTVIAQEMGDVSSDTDTALVGSKEDNDIDNVVQIVPAKCVKVTQRKHISGRKWTENQNTHNPILTMVFQKKL